MQNKFACNCIESGYAQTTNYCPVHSMSNSTQNDEILFTAWYCPKGKLGHYVCYNATQRHIDEHLAECKALPPTQNDWRKRYNRLFGNLNIDENMWPIKEFIAKELADARREVITGLDEKIEKLAEIEHDQWWKWAKTLMDKETLSKERIKRWQKDMVPYKDLPEDVKEYDRKWARKVLATLREEEVK